MGDSSDEESPSQQTTPVVGSKTKARLNRLPNSKKKGSSSSAKKQTAKKRKVNKKGGDGSVKKESSQKRGANFTANEDVCIAKAFVSVSQNPIKGNDQKGSNFWKDVFEAFKVLYEDEEVQMEMPTNRDAKSICNRFQ